VSNFYPQKVLGKTVFAGSAEIQMITLRWESGAGLLEKME
jgi:hypothetical protein